MVGLLIVLWSVVLFNCDGTCRPGHIRLSCNRDFILYITVNGKSSTFNKIIKIMEKSILYLTLKLSSAFVYS